MKRIFKCSRVLVTQKLVLSDTQQAPNKVGLSVVIFVGKLILELYGDWKHFWKAKDPLKVYSAIVRKLVCQEHSLEQKDEDD